MALYLGREKVAPVINAVDLSQTTATADDVLEGKEFYDASGEKVAGTYKDMLQARVDADGCEYLFYYYGKATVDFIKNLDTSKSTSMF